jgi:hypothetical protein
MAYEACKNQAPENVEKQESVWRTVYSIENMGGIRADGIEKQASINFSRRGGEWVRTREKNIKDIIGRILIGCAVLMN